MTHKPKAIVVRAAGTNNEREACLALELAGAEVRLEHIHRVVESPAMLADAALLMIPGGFSYGDDVAAGRIFGLELRQHLQGALRTFVDRGGLVLGVCNGFQVLVETGLLEGEDREGPRDFALTDNASGRFECRWVTLRAEDSACAWLEPGELMPVPIAHAEGRFLVRDEGVLTRMRERRQIALRYVTPDGGPASYPEQPNGSVADIAGVCDPSGRVLGLMPHPERNLSPWNHPTWTRLGPRSEGEGLSFYRRMVQVAADAADTVRSR